MKLFYIVVRIPRDNIEKCINSVIKFWSNLSPKVYNDRKVTSLSGRRSKVKGKGIRARDHARGRSKG